MAGAMTRAMILAAGRGERLRPYTDHLPKPLLEVGGKPLIVRHLESLAAAGVREVIINIGYLGDLIVERLGHQWQGLRIVYSDERSGRLETGGALIRALPQLGDAPFLLVNGDICTDFPWDFLLQAPLASVCLVLVPNPPHHPAGDFALNAGMVALQGEERHTYAGIARINPALLRGYPEQSAPLAPWLRQWIAAGVVEGALYQGIWNDVGTPERWQVAQETCRVRQDGI
ncbi:nucleotidyltransferase family protein [Acidithiobacillus sp. ATCC 19703]|uniref:Nucleotidyltransferase family protein n=2 Tax=Acidithiobacillus concretivorus TaxID=3063952 RepID=A0ABS5ZMB8_9PROT|nr:nucleotidyltransferase family protein [Acidithiobacillus concretivorus]